MRIEKVKSVEFEALIKQFIIKSLVSMDKEAELRLRFNANDDFLISEINRLMKADELVKIRIERE